MNKIPSIKDSKAFLDKMTEADKIWRRRQARLPFAKKLKIMDELLERSRIIKRGH